MSTRKRIVVDGTEYEGVEQMPPDVRRTYERVLSLLEGRDVGDHPDFAGLGDAETHTVEIHDTDHRIVVDGEEYAAVEEMPPDARALYRKLTGEAGSGGAALADSDTAVVEDEVHRVLRQAEPEPVTVPWLGGALTGALFMAVLLLLVLLLFQT